MSKKKTNTRTELLSEADGLINGQRQDDYGKPEDNFRRIADRWTVTLEQYLKPGVELPPYAVALCMADVKLSRIVTTPKHHDSYTDGLGYLALAGELVGA